MERVSFLLLLPSPPPLPIRLHFRLNPELESGLHRWFRRTSPTHCMALCLIWIVVPLTVLYLYMIYNLLVAFQIMTGCDTIFLYLYCAMLNVRLVCICLLLE